MSYPATSPPKWLRHITETCLSGDLRKACRWLVVVGQCLLLVVVVLVTGENTWKYCVLSGETVRVI